MICIEMYLKSVEVRRRFDSSHIPNWSWAVETFKSHPYGQVVRVFNKALKTERKASTHGSSGKK